MKTKHFKFLFFTLFITLLCLQKVFPNIITGTPIKTGTSINDYAFIENLKVGGEVLSCKATILENGKLRIKFIKIPIKEIKKEKLNKLVLIETNIGQLCVGENKRFYNSKNNSWVDAKHITPNDKLLDVNFNNISIEKIIIENLDEEIDSYKLLLEEPHIFFICDSNGNLIFVHNYAIPYPVIEQIIEKGPELLGVAAGSILALLGVKSALNNNHHKHTLDIKRKADIRQQYIEALQDKVSSNKATLEDLERLHLFEDFPGISDEEVDRRIEENRKLRECYIKASKINIKKYEQFIQTNNSVNNINLNNDVSAQQEKQPPVIDNDNDKSQDENNENVNPVDNLLKGAIKEPPTKGRAKIFSKPGGEKERQEDFDKLNSSVVKEPKKGFKIGKTKNGNTVISREESKDSRPTLEIQEKTSSGKIKYIKIRYKG
ncbi:hypothetical protein ACFLYH_00695 [Candidatus Dependentiae bacterium]